MIIFWSAQTMPPGCTEDHEVEHSRVDHLHLDSIQNKPPDPNLESYVRGTAITHFRICHGILAGSGLQQLAVLLQSFRGSCSCGCVVGGGGWRAGTWRVSKAC